MNTPLRRAGVAAASLTLALALVACGGSDGSDDSDGPSDDTSSSDAAGAAAPTEAELSTVLLTADDVPEGYTQSDVDADDDDDVFADTCLADVSDFDDQVGSDPASKAETQFTLEDQTGQAQILSGASYYDDEDALVAAFDSFYASFQDCTNVTFTDATGNAYDIDVTADDSVSIDGVDSQLTFDLSGTVTAGDQSLPVDFDYLVVRQGAAISRLATSEVGQDYGLADQLEPLAVTQSGRLADVLG